MKPVIALVGRPNVGKSTLFNRITKSRDAIVADFAGLTRDRHYGNARLGSREFIVIDTGGFEPDASSGIFMEMAKQTQQAVAEADVVIFVVDRKVAWNCAVPMALAAIGGGYLGARLALRVKPRMVRWIVIAIGLKLRLAI